MGMEPTAGGPSPLFAALTRFCGGRYRWPPVLEEAQSLVHRQIYHSDTMRSTAVVCDFGDSHICWPR